MMDDSSHAYRMPVDHNLYRVPQFNNNNWYQANNISTDPTLEYESEVSFDSNNALGDETHPPKHGELIKLDSFGRWMNKEIGKDCDDSLIASSSHWNDLETDSCDNEVTSLSRHMHLDNAPLAPSLQDQLFSILDFSPDWTFSGVETKVLISGRFLGNVKPANFKWCCMFGEYEVPAELLPTNALRCQAPAHTPGRVPFYITCSNRLACSEVREFEYRENLSVNEDDIRFQVRFAKMTSLGLVERMLACAIKNCQNCNLKKKLFPILCDVTGWENFEKNRKDLHWCDRWHKDAFIQHMLKRRLFEWLVCKSHEECKGLNALDEEGQGIIHLAAALGYHWAMRPIVVAGISPIFGDARGRTALHWAAYYSREETILELIKLGAAPGAMEDPTSKYLEGQTAAELAWIRVHKRIAGYLAEFHAVHVHEECMRLTTSSHQPELGADGCSSGSRFKFSFADLTNH